MKIELDKSAITNEVIRLTALWRSQDRLFVEITDPLMFEWGATWAVLQLAEAIENLEHACSTVCDTDLSGPEAYLKEAAEEVRNAYRKLNPFCPVSHEIKGGDDGR